MFKKYYLAYGSNLNLSQMAYRCPNAKPIGTINLDYRSLYHHFECGVYIYNSSVIKNIKQNIIDTLDKSRLINKKNFKPNLLKELFNAILRLIAPLL